MTASFQGTRREDNEAVLMLMPLLRRYIYCETIDELRHLVWMVGFNDICTRSRDGMTELLVSQGGITTWLQQTCGGGFEGDPAVVTLLKERIYEYLLDRGHLRLTF